MNEEFLEKRNKLIAKHVGWEEAFKSLANYTTPEDLFTWQGYFLDEHNIKIQGNDPCPCGSGKKYKKCCGKNNI